MSGKQSDPSGASFDQSVSRLLRIALRLVDASHALVLRDDAAPRLQVVREGELTITEGDLRDVAQQLQKPDGDVSRFMLALGCQDEPSEVSLYSVIGFPIVVSTNQILGTVLIADRGDAAWTEDDVHDLQQVVDMIGEVCRVRRWLQRNEVRLKEVDALTKQLGIENSLKESLGELGSIGSWEMDSDRDEIIWSKSLYEMHGVDLSYQPSATGLNEFYDAEAFDQLFSAFAEALESNSRFDIDLPMTTRDGHSKTVRSIGRCYRGDGGKVKSVGIVVDITDKVELGKKERFRQDRDALKGRIQEMFLKGDEKRAFDHALEGLLELTGSEYGFIGEIAIERGVPYLISHAITDISWDDETKEIYQQNLESGFEFRNLDTLFGATIIGRVSVFANDPESDPRAGGLPPGHPELKTYMGLPIFLGAEMVAMVGMANREDGYSQEIADQIKPLLEVIATFMTLIRERKRRQATEQKLELARVNAEALSEKLLWATATGSIGIWEFFPDTGELRWNATMMDIHGINQEDFQGVYEDWLDRVHPEDLYEAEVALNESLATGEPFEAEFRIVRPDGTIRYLKGNASEVQTFDGRRVLMGMNADLTEYIEARQNAEAATSMKSAFLANMSHEIRTPLNGIIAISELLNAEATDPKQKELLSLLNRSGGTLLAIVNDILDVSRIEAGKLELDARKVDIVGEMHTALYDLRNRAMEKGLEFNVSVAEDVRGQYLADPVRFRQIVANLVSNAVKFTDKGKVSVEVRVGAFDLDSHTEEVNICVCDTGTGFSDAFKERLFERFAQADSSVTRNHGGSGLGLSIVKSLVDLMGGTINVSSTVGKGSTFRVSLPLEKSDEPEEDIRDASVRHLEDADEQIAEGGCRVLLAEDHVTNQKVVELILDPLDVQLDIVENGQEAIDAFHKNHYDLILMDMQMPVLDGLTAVLKIRSIEVDEFRSRTPIAMLSANVMEEHKAMAEQAGCDAFIAKPITPKSLIDKVLELLPREELSSKTVRI